MKKTFNMDFDDDAGLYFIMDIELEKAVIFSKVPYFRAKYNNRDILIIFGPRRLCYAYKLQNLCWQINKFEYVEINMSSVALNLFDRACNIHIDDSDRKEALMNLYLLVQGQLGD